MTQFPPNEHHDASLAMSEPFVAASVQMVSGTQVSENLRRAEYWIAQAAQAGAKLVVLPEYFCLMGFDEVQKVKECEPYGTGPIQQALSNVAAQHNIWLVGGTIPLSCPVREKVYNTTLLFGPDGVTIARYDKIHLFGFSGLGETYCESKTILAGKKPVSVDTPLGRLAFGICYDLRFPELFRAIFPYDVLILPAAFTTITGEAHWEILLRARAIENQSYVIASAQGGKHENGRRTYGHSIIIDPWGRILAELSAEGEGVITATIEPSTIKTVRSHLPAWQHRVIGS